MSIFGLLYFILNYIVMKYNLLYTSFQPYEAGGKLWLAAAKQFVFALVFFQLVRLSGCLCVDCFLCLLLVRQDSDADLRHSPCM